MVRTKMAKRQRPARRMRPFRTSLWLEQLEDRNLLTNGLWLAVIGGITPAGTLDQQATIGQNVLHASGLQDQDVAVTKALDLSGAFVVQAPVDVTQQTLTTELQQIPGFIFVQDYNPDAQGGEGDDNNGVNGDFIDGDGYNATFGGPFDYQTFLREQANGQLITHAGPVTTPAGTNDVLTNNNLGGNTSAGFTHSETTTIAFGNTVLVGFNDSGEYNLAGNKFTGWSRSTNGGATFTDGGPLPNSANGDAGDPVLARNETNGRVFYATLQFSGSGMDIFHSDDGGATWSAPVQGAPGKSGLQDKEWIAVDNFAGAGNGNVYHVERDFGGGNGIYFFRSTDNGATFGPNGGTLIASAGATQGAFVTVTPDHAIEVFYFNGSVNQMRKSTDQGLTFGAPVTVVSGLIGGVNGDLGLTGIRKGTSFASGFRSSEFPHAAVNPINGNLYVTYDNKGSGTDKADVFLVQSTNGGATWSAPLKVNDDTTNTDQWQPTIAVTPDGSKLGIFYYSRQEDPNNNLFKYYGRVATIVGSTLTFAPSFAVSDTASLPEFGRDGDVNTVYMGDYNTAFATPGAFEVSWSDNRFDLPGSTTNKEPDVFFKKIQLGLQVVSTTPAAGSLVLTQPTVFTVNVTDPINPASLQAGAFKVNGIAATSASYTPNSTTITFTFASTPVTAEGLQTMHIDAGAFTRASDGNPLGQFDATFRYTALQLQVTSTNPPVGGRFTIPASSFSFDVNFNKAVDPTSVKTTSLTLSGIPGAFVSAVTVPSGNTTAHFTLSGLGSVGTLTANIAAGAITDAFGNPGAAFSGSYVVALGLRVLSTTPAVGTVDIGFQRTVFTVNVSDPVTPASLAANAFQVNGISATSVSYTPGSTTITFTYASTPVTAQGLQTMHISAGAFTRAFDGTAVLPFDGTFRYDAILLQVTSTNPPFPNGVFTLPGPFTFDVNFNEAVAPGSITTTKLTLSGIPGAFVSGVTVLSGNQAARFTIAGITTSGALTTSIAAGAITDAFGNPGAAFTATYFVHYNQFAYPRPLAPVNPLGSLIYDPFMTGTIGSPAVTDSFTLPLLAGQTLSLLATPTGTTLRPMVQLFDSSNTLVASATAPAAGKPALLNTTAITASGTYTMVVSGAASTTGSYRIQAYLDTALEAAVNGGPADTSRATAQDLGASFVQISALDSSPQRGAVLGQTQATTANYVATVATSTFDDISTTGTRTLVDADFSFATITPAGFSFNFYGRNYTTFYLSTKGHITFGSGSTDSSPGDLTTRPPQATIAPLWEDIVTTSTGSNPDRGVYWQVKGTGADQRLIVQWENVHTFGSSGLFTFEAVLSNNGSFQYNYQSLANTNEGRSASVGVKDAGTQGPNRLLLSYFGSGPQYVGSNKSTTLSQGTLSSEYYSFHLDTGQSATLALTSLDGKVVTEELQDSTGTVLALGRTGPTNVGAIINNFVAPSSGTYYVRIGGDSFANYSLVVTRDADFDTKPNADFLSGPAQMVLSSTTTSGQTVLGYLAGPELNTYQVQMQAGQTLQVQTQTPLDGTGGPVSNQLRPRVNLYGPDGTLITTSSGSAADGKNVLLSYICPDDNTVGYYFVQVGSANGSAGEYVLTISGATGAEPDFAVATINPADKSSSKFTPSTITVGFNASLLMPSVTAGSLKVDGQAATAFKILSATTVQFTLPTLAAGHHTVAIASTVLDVCGRPLDAYQGDFTVDTIGPRVIGSSLNDGAVLSSGTFDYVVTFDKPLDATKVNNADFLLHGNFGNLNFNPDSFTYIDDTSVLTLHYASLPSDQYTLTLVNGVNNLVDLAGNPLDGAPHWPTPPSPSSPSGTGNPFSTGNFFVHFSVPVGTVAYPTNFTQLKPQGSLIYQGQTVKGFVLSAADTPQYTLAVNAGETITVLVTPTAGTFQPTVTLLDANNNVVATAQASAAGKPALLQTAPAAGDPQTNQVYTIQIGGVSGSTGGYTLQVTLDAALQQQDVAAASQVSLAGAFNQVGIVADGSTFGAGIDGFGFALSGNLLGTTQNSSGVSFTIGAVGGNNVVSAAGQTINLPAGTFSSLQFLATAVNGNQPGQTFTVTYTDLTTATFTQGISDWFTPQQFAGEANAVPMAYRDMNNGGMQNATFCVYGYSLNVNPAKTVKSFTLPNNSHLKILAETLVLAGNHTLASAQDLTPSFAALPKGASGAAVLGTFNGADDYYAFQLTQGQQVTLGATFSQATRAYSTRSDIAVGSGPLAVTYADVRGVGKKDLITANYNANSVTIRPGNGDGTFGAATSISVGSSPYSVATADLRGIGRVDIITANSGSNSVTVLYNNGNGTYTRQDYAVGSFPISVAVGDFEGTGRQSIVTANNSSRNVSVLYNNGSQSFTRQDYNVGTSSSALPYFVAVGNFNGKPDIVTANYYNISSDSVTVLLNNGSRSFTARNLDAGSSTTGVAVGDFRGNGKLDIVATNYSIQRVAVLLGNGDGTFGAAQFYTTDLSPYEVAVGNIDGTGHASIATANFNSSVSVLIGNGTGTFQPKYDLATSGFYNYGVALTDLRGTGLADLSVANYSSSNVNLWLNQTSNLQLQLLDSSGTVLKTGSAASNLNAVINNFVAPATGTYYARFTGIGSTAYDLVVTRNAAFDTGVHDTLATAQDFSGTAGALGYLASTSAGAVVPNSLANVSGNSPNAFPFNIGGFASQMHYQQLYTAAQFGSGGVIDALRFRRGAGYPTFSSTTLDIKISLGYASTTVGTISTTFANNVGTGGLITVFDGTMTISSTGTGSPNPFDIVLPAGDLFNYDPTQGNLLLDILMRNAPATTYIDAANSGQQNVMARVWSTSLAASSGSTDGAPYGLVTRFDMVAGTKSEWYKFTAPEGQTVSLATYTPGDGGGVFVNNLAAHIELYTADGTLVATGVVGPDGHNEQISYDVPIGAGGTYYIKISSANGQPGEFFLDPEETPTALPAGASVASGVALSARLSGLEPAAGVAIGLPGGDSSGNYGVSLVGSPFLVAVTVTPEATTETAVAGSTDARVFASSPESVLRVNSGNWQETTPLATETGLATDIGAQKLFDAAMDRWGAVVRAPLVLLDQRTTDRDVRTLKVLDDAFAGDLDFCVMFENVGAAPA
jgi:hypothetical protein